MEEIRAGEVAQRMIIENSRHSIVAQGPNQIP